MGSVTMIHIQVRIRSRAFGVTFGTFDKTWDVNVFSAGSAKATLGYRVDNPICAFDKVLHDSRGVFVRVWA